MSHKNQQDSFFGVLCIFSKERTHQIPMYGHTTHKVHWSGFQQNVRQKIERGFFRSRLTQPSTRSKHTTKKIEEEILIIFLRSILRPKQQKHMNNNMYQHLNEPIFFSLIPIYTLCIWFAYFLKYACLWNAKY